MRGWIALLLLAPALAGCLSSTPDEAGPSQPTLPSPSDVAAVPDPIIVEFTVTDASGQPVPMEALVWPGPNATTAILLVHGLSGVKENYYHTLPEEGYSLGARFALTGRTVVAIDLPGYSDTPGPPNGLPIEEHARTVAEIAALLKAGVPETGLPAVEAVPAYGLSMGAVAVAVAAGQHDDLDAIAPAGLTHRGLGMPPYCFAEPSADPSCPVPPEDDFWLPNADPDVVNATVAGYEDGSEHATELSSIMELFGGCGATNSNTDGATCDPEVTPLDAITDEVRVPVLSLVGLEDRLLDPSAWEDEPSHYPMSPDPRVHGFEEMGHFVHNHRNQAEVVHAIDAWLDEQGV